jgi:hypothetical protein
MKKGDLYRIKEGLEGFEEVKNGSFAYKVIKNLQLVTSEIELLDKLREPNDEYKEKVQAPVQKLVRKYAITDEEGEIVETMTPQGSSISVDPAKEKEFVEERSKLLDKESVLVEKYEKQIDEFMKVLDEDSDIDFILFKEVDIPDQVTVKQLYQVKELLVD